MSERTLRHRIDAIVIGASAGGVEALGVLLPAVPTTLRVPVFAVLHLPREHRSLLPDIFQPKCARPVREAQDKEPVEAGTIYFAPPDYHLLVEAGRTFALSQDDRVHYSRPAVDVLFESAAEAYGERLMAVVLSGANRDGAAGLKAVADAGGVAVVQSLESAEMVAMPAAALEAVPKSLELNVSALAELLRARTEVTQRNDNGR